MPLLGQVLFLVIRRLAVVEFIAVQPNEFAPQTQGNDSADIGFSAPDLGIS